MKTAVVVPALNEAGNIAELVEAVFRQPVDHVIVVDNGSEDDTAARALAAGAVVVAEPRRGYGYACAAGSRQAGRLGADIVVYIDGDHSSDPGQMRSLLAPLLADEADLVLGSRVMGQIAPGAMHWHQRFGNRLAAAVTRRRHGIIVTDLGPYRAIRAGLLERLNMTEMTFGWPTEMTVNAARLGARIVEVPVTWSPRREGKSKVSGTVRGSVLAGYHILRVILRSPTR